MNESDLTQRDALVIVDVQHDFCAGGALPVPQGAEIVDPLNAWIAQGQHRRAVIVASRDWHPRAHPSFKAEGCLGLRIAYKILKGQRSAAAFGCRRKRSSSAKACGSTATNILHSMKRGSPRRCKSAGLSASGSLGLRSMSAYARPRSTP